MRTIQSLTLVALLATAPVAVRADNDQTVTKENMATSVATVQAVDKTTRSVILRNEKGEEDTFVVGPEVTRFDQIKVGDKLRLTYQESMIFQVRKPGEASKESTSSLSTGRLNNAVGGVITKQQTRTVTVKAVDPTVPSITVVTPDNRTVTRKIEDKKNIEGVKPGDRIDISYTQALVVDVEPAQ